jgi:hypothetical protein
MLQKNYIKNKIFFFNAYGQVSQKIKKNHIGFSYNKKNYRKYLACILALITSLLKP